MIPTMLATFALTITVTGQTASGGQAPHDINEQRLELMKESVKSYEFTLAGDRVSAITLRPDPAFRLGRQGNGGILEGAIFLWADEVGRPEAAAQVFLLRHAGRPDGQWLHEFTSLSTGTFTARQGGVPRWSPEQPGVVFQPVPDAPRPAAAPTSRLRQIRALAADFRAEDNFGNVGWEVLRMLSTPIARYGKTGGTPEDGALFAFVEGTDPEAFLFLEARPGKQGLEWQYALAPMSCWALKVQRKGQLVWSLPLRSTDNATKPFFSRAYQP
jgi:hypothetical protein